MRGARTAIAAGLLCLASGCGDAPPPLAPKPAVPAPAVPCPAPDPFAGMWELRIVRTRPASWTWTGTLLVPDARAGGQASVCLDFVGDEPLPATAERVSDGSLGVVVDLSRHSPGRSLRLALRADGDALAGESQFEVPGKTQTDWAGASRIAVRRFDGPAPAGDMPRESDPAAVGVDPAGLDRLIHYAEHADSDALVVVKDGRVVCERTFGRPRVPVNVMSITKAVSSLAVPLLVEDGKIDRDLAQPVATWITEWKDHPRKSRITLRQLLTHTTGVVIPEDERAQVDAADELAVFTQQDARWEPGSRYQYSNAMFGLLSAVVARAAGEPIDAYLARRVFSPMGLRQMRWGRDEKGAVQTWNHLDLTGPELARIGWLVCRRGSWEGRQLVPEWFFDAASVPSAVNREVGLAWWLLRDPRGGSLVMTEEALERLREESYAQADALRPLVGRVFGTRDEWARAVVETVGEEAACRLEEKHLLGTLFPGDVRGKVIGLHHSGFLGQWLLVYPESGLVVVRLRHGAEAEAVAPEVAARSGMHTIVPLSAELARR